MPSLKKRWHLYFGNNLLYMLGDYNTNIKLQFFYRKEWHLIYDE